jgi:hypothetical protein
LDPGKFQLDSEKKDLIYRVAPKIIGKNFVPKNSPEITGFFVEKSGATAPLALLGSKSSTCARAAGLPIRREAGVAPNFSR